MPARTAACVGRDTTGPSASGTTRAWLARAAMAASAGTRPGASSRVTALPVGTRSQTTIGRSRARAMSDSIVVIVGHTMQIIIVDDGI